MEEITKFLKSPLGAVVATVVVVFVAEKYFSTNLAGLPKAIQAKFTKA